MLTLTAYYAQTDGQSERLNQVVKIALRYFLTSSPDSEQTEALTYIQSTYNNVKNASIGFAPNEILTGFKSNLDTIFLLIQLLIVDYALLRLAKSAEVDDAIVFANTTIKTRYNSKHKPLQLKIGDQVYFRLYKGYKVPGHASKKYSQQREGLFTIKRLVGVLVYELEGVKELLKIYPVVSIAQLELGPEGEDPFERKRDI